jgi:dipeptidyl-peptidase-4
VKRIVASLPVLLVALFTCTAFPQTEQPAGAAGQQTLTIEQIFRAGGLTGRLPQTFAWSPDNTKVSFVQRDASGEHGALWYVDAATGQKAVLVSEDKLATLAPPLSKLKSEREKERVQRYSVAAYEWAPDSRHLIFDSVGQLWYYSLASGTAVALTSSPDPSSDPKFSPDGKRLAFVRRHNLFVHAIDMPGERQLTQSPHDDENILNGEVDWVYAEELGVRSNYFWSPNGKQIVFLQMNEARVPTYPLTNLMETHPPVDAEKYPKAGDPNPEVKLGVVDANGGKVKWISLGKDPDVYVPRFGWVRDGVVYAQVLNRAQDKLDLYFAEAGSGRSRRVLEETSPNWVPVTDDFQVFKSADRFLWSSWRDGNTHLYLYSFDQHNPLAADAKLERQLEKGEYEVFGVEGVDEAAGRVYFIANRDNVLDRQLYSVSLQGGEVTRLTLADGTHAVSISKDGKAYVDWFSDLTTPTNISFCKTGGECHFVWHAQRLAPYNLVTPKFVDFKAEDGTILHGTLFLPPNGESAAPGSIPLIMNPYGGPGAQIVTNSFGGGGTLFTHLMAQRGFATLIVDNRGMAGRGQKFTAVLRHHFGDTELKDQLAALDQALQANPIFDRNRLGWWGWSYGGYMTLYAMTHSDRFRVGVAGAPVTNWLNYDSIYTERYMGLPKDNAEAYRTSSPVHNAADLKGRLLLVHGTGDDNVHFQNSVQMVQGLIDAGKQFDFMIYPGKTHGISGPADQMHLYHLVLDHFERNLGHAATAGQ